jgi:SAM-dependent methyltransferase
MGELEEYQQRERRRRDEGAAGYDRWYVDTKGALFDRTERSIFVDAARNAGLDSILDLGSGTGRICEHLAGPDRTTVAVDLSLESLRVLGAKNLPRVVALCAAGQSLPFHDASFDLAISCQVLQHLKPVDLDLALDELHRVLVTGGRLLVSVYNLDRVGRRPAEEGGVDSLYIRRFAPGEVRELAALHHFGVQRVGYYKAIPASLGRATNLLPVERLLRRVWWLRRRICGYLFIELRAL